MKVKRDALKLARAFFRASFTDGHLDPQKVREASDFLVREKPRNYFGALSAFSRFVRLELERNHAIVESAEPLDETIKSEVQNDLVARFGNHITMEFHVNPELIGGLRVQVGSNVWDGSVHARLETLKEQL